jgi:hypothetical protein
VANFGPYDGGPQITKNSPFLPFFITQFLSLFVTQLGWVGGAQFFFSFFQFCDVAEVAIII